MSAYKKQDGRLQKLTNPGPENPNGKYFSGAGEAWREQPRIIFAFAKCCSAMGQANGVRLVSRKTIEMMTANQIGKIPLWQDAYRGYSFGLGFRVREHLGESATLQDR